MAEDLANAAKTLAKHGASKGGRERARRMTKEARSASARLAAATRWNEGHRPDENVPWAVAEGFLTFRDRQIACAVLEDERRVLTQQGVLTAIGRARAAKGGQGASTDGLPAFLRARNLVDFISDGLREATKPIIFRPLQGGYTSSDGYRGIAYGCDARTLPAVCKVYVDADNAGRLVATQRHIAQEARLLLEGLGDIAMVALVDEATGYQEIRAENELRKILEAYVLPEQRPWVKTVPVEFIKEIYRVWGWKVKDDTTRGPRFAAKILRQYVYGQLPAPVLPALDRKNPAGKKSQRRYKHHQFLSEDLGIEQFKMQLAEVSALLRASRDKEEFKDLFRRAFSNNEDVRTSRQLSLPLEARTSKVN